MAIHSWLLVSLICIAPLAYGQQGTVAGPLSGFVFDNSAQTLRPVRGVAGAATMGDPLNAGFNLASAYVSPLQDSVFAKAADGSVHFFAVTGGTVSEQAVTGLGAVERVAFSPSGTAAALYAAGNVQLLTGLPGAPVVSGSLKLGADGHNRMALTSFAVSDDGGYVLLAVGDSVRLVSQSAGSHSLMTTGYGATVAFSPGGHDAAVAVRGMGVVLIHDVAGDATQRILAPDNVADDPSFAAIAGLAFSRDGQKLFVGSISAQSVAAFDVAAGTRNDFACDCTPSGLSPMGNLFRLTELGAGPLWLLDAGSAGPRIVFVPALKGNS